MTHSARRDPGLYIDECSNAIFSLLKKPFAPTAARRKSAVARLRSIPLLLEQARQNLQEPVEIYAQLAIEAIGGIEPLFTVSLKDLLDGATAVEESVLSSTSAKALDAIRTFGRWLSDHKKADARFAIGPEAYSFLLHSVYLLSLDAEAIATLGEVELTRSKALEGWSTFPRFQPSAVADLAEEGLPATQSGFLERYERFQGGLVSFLRAQRILTVPADIGPFRIRELPQVFKPTAPGGFMNAPGVYDDDPSGFYFIPTFDPQSHNFFLRAAIDDPRPILGHEGIPGHHLQLSISNRHPSQIRRHHHDPVFVEGWAFYTEEMLWRLGLYHDRPRTEQQINRLMRLRAARVTVDVRLATGAWSLEQAVGFLMKDGGMDREAAVGEASDAAANPGQKLIYTLGKWQVCRLLGLYRDKSEEGFTLCAFHDDVLSHGAIPVSLMEWEMLGREDAWSAVQAVRRA